MLNKNFDDYFYPALTGSKTPISRYREKREIYMADQLLVKVRLVRANKMLVPQVLPQDVALLT